MGKDNMLKLLNKKEMCNKPPRHGHRPRHLKHHPLQSSKHRLSQQETCLTPHPAVIIQQGHFNIYMI